MKSRVIILFVVSVALFSCDKTPTPEKTQENLVGDWEGSVLASYGEQWQVSISIEEDGHYSSYVINVQSGSVLATFDNGDDDLDDPEKKFEIHYIDSEDRGHGVVTLIHYDGDMLEYELHDVKFNKDKDQLDFEVYVFDGPAKMMFDLTRQ